MTIKKYELREVQDILPLQAEWARLEKGPDMTVFQTHEWHRLLLREWHGWRLHALYSRVILYMAYENDAPVMLFPAIIYKFSTKTKWFGQPKGVYLLGQGSYSDYMSVIFDRFSPAAFEAIEAEIRRDFPGYPIVLSSLRPDNPLAGYLTRRQVKKEECDVSLTIPRQESAEQYTMSLDRKIRENLRRSLKRMEKDEITYELSVTGPIRDQALLSRLVDLHVRRILIKNTKHEGLLHVASSHIRKLYRKHRDLHNNIVAMSMSENPASVVIVIRLNGQPVGYEYGLRDGGAVRMLQTCFDDGYRKYSPGFRALYDFVLRCYEDESIREIDLLRGDEHYKYELGGQEIKLYEFTL